MTLWGGRFEGGPDPLFQQLNDSLPFDYQLAPEDIEGSIAWAKALRRCGVLDDHELSRLTSALDALAAEVREDPRAPLEHAGARPEDVHSWVEQRLVASLGTLGKKLHTGRSRNDQVATDLRLWVRRRIDARVVECRAARAGLIEFARSWQGVAIPGYTHLQRGQPVLLSHWALAYEAMLARDTRRLLDARARANECPLGSGALAGTAYAIDRDQLARDLGFDRATSNSLDAVSDRDFVVESLSALAILGTHLSRLGEDLVLFGSQEFAFFEYDDAFSSGSSLMPQKKNPDAAELLRGKAGRVVGALVSMLVTLKGLPLAYNKDLQEDKEPIFDAMRHASLCLRSVPRILQGIRVNAGACGRAAMGGYTNATELADALVARGVPFREAHEQVGRLVRRAIELAKPIEGLPLEELRRFAPACDQGVYEALTLASALAKREIPGGTGPNAVRGAIARAQSALEREA